MSSRRSVISGKMISQHGIEVNGREDGSIHVRVKGEAGGEQQVLTVAGPQAITLIDLLCDLVHYENDIE